MSFATGLVLLLIDIDAAFYLAAGRVWELLIGALLALGAVPRLRASVFAISPGCSA